jgi:hypothetical protein
MLKAITLLFTLFLFHNSSIAQGVCACCTDYHKQFDFWVGEWNVYDTSGNLLGENRIEKLEDNCILNEHWKGAKGYTGSSYNYFDLKDSTWNQVWIDGQGKSLVLQGSGSPNQMVMRSKLLKGKKVDWYYNRVSWTAKDDGSVEQLWELLDKEDKVLTTAFFGIYKRK